MQRFVIARIGRCNGLKGDLKLNEMTDFPEQFCRGNCFWSDAGLLEIERYDPHRGVIRFVGYDSVEVSGRLVNAFLYADAEQSRRTCRLEAREYFWFDIIGLKVREGDETIGRVKEIQRLAGTDYLQVVSEDIPVRMRGFARTFLVPYVERYVERVDLERGEIVVSGAGEIAQNS